MEPEFVNCRHLLSSLRRVCPDANPKMIIEDLCQRIAYGEKGISLSKAKGFQHLPCCNGAAFILFHWYPKCNAYVLIRAFPQNALPFLDRPTKKQKEYFNGLRKKLKRTMEKFF